MQKPSKYEDYEQEILSMLGEGVAKGAIARKLKEKHKLPEDCEAIRKHVAKVAVRNEHPALAQECEATGIPIEEVRHFWYKGKHFSLFVKGKEADYDELRADIISEVKAHSPKYPKLTYRQPTDGHLLVIDPADIHLNKLCSAFETGEDCTHELIYQRVKEGVNGIVNKAQGFPVDKILFVAGNDILHVDNPNNTTTSGTRQDVSLMWYDAFTLARKLMVECIEMLLPIAPVHFMYNPSNHDWTQGFFLAQTIEAWFSKCSGITFDINMAHRKYMQYGANLIGTTHGDGAKEQDLPLLMAHEAPKYWAESKHRYIYMHHIHHKKSKDYMSVCVEALRSPSGTDSWHHRNAYQHAPKAIEGFVHHKEFGQIARLTHIF